jgi:hypothetical protein
MPYYVFRVRPYAQIEKLDEFDVFKEASARAKALRAADSGTDVGKVKVMFADSQALAKDLLCQIRDPGPSGDD